MFVKCPVCGAHMPREAAVEIPTDEGLVHFCSLRCAEASDARPVLKAPLPSLPDLPKKILVAVDGSGPSLRATELAVSLARTSGGSVELLHAIDPALARLVPVERAFAPAEAGSPTGEAVQARLRKDAEAQVARCRRVCEEAGVPVGCRIEVGAPASAISEAASSFDLVVMGSRGLGAVSGAMLGSLSHRVLGLTRQPVLVVH